MTTPVHIADGTHQHIRWHVMRDDAGTFVTLSGFVGSAYVFNQVDVPSASPASVRALVEAEIIAVKSRNSRQTELEAVF